MNFNCWILKGCFSFLFKCIYAIGHGLQKYHKKKPHLITTTYKLYNGWFPKGKAKLVLEVSSPFTWVQIIEKLRQIIPKSKKGWVKKMVNGCNTKVYSRPPRMRTPRVRNSKGADSTGLALMFKGCEKIQNVRKITSWQLRDEATHTPSFFTSPWRVVS